MLRPGNAAANSIGDHTAVLDAAVEAMGADFAAGHREGDDPGLVRVQLRVRADSAGCTKFVHECRKRGIGFSVVARRNTDVQAAVSRAADMAELWQPALKAQNKTGSSSSETGKGAAEVADLTAFVSTSGWPDRTRLIVRREPRHPGAQRSLLPSHEYRLLGALDRQHAQRRRVRPAHASPRPCGRHHRTRQGRRRQQVPLHRL